MDWRKTDKWISDKKIIRLEHGDWQQIEYIQDYIAADGNQYSVAMGNDGNHYYVLHRDSFGPIWYKKIKGV